MIGLGGNQHLAVAQRLDVVGIGWSTAVTFLLGMSGLKLHRAGLVGDQRRVRMRTKKACSGPGALAASQAASTSMARA
ncbi:hypothetical protein V5279_08170 [Bradyrhizobium sp. 26S5]